MFLARIGAGGILQSRLEKEGTVLNKQPEQRELPNPLCKQGKFHVSLLVKELQILLKNPFHVTSNAHTSTFPSAKNEDVYASHSPIVHIPEHTHSSVPPVARDQLYVQRFPSSIA